MLLIFSVEVRLNDFNIRKENMCHLLYIWYIAEENSQLEGLGSTGFVHRIICTAHAMGSLITKHEDVTTPFKSFYDINCTNINGEKMELEKNTVTLVVNTAAEWAKKRQIPAMLKLYNKYKDQGFRLILCPCNQFNKQEPGTNAEIKQKYAAQFSIPAELLHSKLDVQGDGIHDIYRYLRSANLKNQSSGKNGIEWNFQKYVVDRDGQVIKRYGPAVTPESLDTPEKIQAWL